MTQTTATGLLPKDYIMAAEELYFAVLLPAVDAESYLHCSLRYVCDALGRPRKLDTTRALALLQNRYPAYLGYSQTLDTEAILVPFTAVSRIYRARDGVARLRRLRNPEGLKRTALHAVEFLEQKGIDARDMGITGSLLLGFENVGSDIDLVIYDAGAFHRARNTVKESLDAAELQSMDIDTWRHIHARRNCALDFGDYLMHERRKYNKFMMDGVRIDLSYVPAGGRANLYKPPIRKLGPATLQAVVVDDEGVFDYPARYIIDDDRTDTVLCYTATYIGQAFKGERIEAAGIMEKDADGNTCLVIGTSREAPGEYLKVIDPGPLSAPA